MSAFSIGAHSFADTRESTVTTTPAGHAGDVVTTSSLSANGSDASDASDGPSRSTAACSPLAALRNDDRTCVDFTIFAFAGSSPIAAFTNPGAYPAFE